MTKAHTHELDLPNIALIYGARVHLHERTDARTSPREYRIDSHTLVNARARARTSSPGYRTDSHTLMNARSPPRTHACQQGAKYYQVPYEMGITEILPRTPGLSTSDLIRRCKEVADGRKDQ